MGSNIPRAKKNHTAIPTGHHGFTWCLVRVKGSAAGLVRERGVQKEEHLMGVFQPLKTEIMVNGVFSEP